MNKSGRGACPRCGGMSDNLADGAVSAFSDLKSLRWLAVNEVRAELDGPRGEMSIDPAANAITRFNDDHANSSTAQPPCRCETGRACSDNQNICVFIHTSV